VIVLKCGCETPDPKAASHTQEAFKITLKTLLLSASPLKHWQPSGVLSITVNLYGWGSTECCSECSHWISRPIQGFTWCLFTERPND